MKATQRFWLQEAERLAVLAVSGAAAIEISLPRSPQGRKITPNGSGIRRMSVKFSTLVRTSLSSCGDISRCLRRHRMKSATAALMLNITIGIAPNLAAAQGGASLPVGHWAGEVGNVTSDFRISAVGPKSMAGHLLVTGSGGNKLTDRNFTAWVKDGSFDLMPSTGAAWPSYRGMHVEHGKLQGTYTSRPKF
jgi:hypothetical protein